MANLPFSFLSLFLNGFEWDEGNLIKNFIKHKITFLEAEEVFHNEEAVSKT